MFTVVRTWTGKRTHIAHIERDMTAAEWTDFKAGNDFWAGERTLCKNNVPTNVRVKSKTRTIADCPECGMTDIKLFGGKLYQHQHQDTPNIQTVCGERATEYFNDARCKGQVTCPKCERQAAKA